ncbi:10150_t:CDS:10, partial [Entrophospora sp. SA101]
ISNPDSINENVITENSSLPNNSFGYVSYYGAETARSRKDDDRWYSKLGNICCFPSQNCNVISYIKELKNVMTKPSLYRYVFMFVPLNIIHGVAFGIILFPAHDRYDNSNQKLFGAYKYVGMMMFFTSRKFNFRQPSRRKYNDNTINTIFTFDVTEIIENHASANLYVKYDVVYTIIFAYAINAILTGVGLLLFVQFKFRFFLDIFPRHIYNGVLGGIGIYLICTAIKISVPNSDVPLEPLLEQGWIFALDNQITMSEFYSNFRKLIGWEAIGETISTMFTLTFFAMLSANVKISKLEVSIDDHKLNIDHELFVQGVSNLIAGVSGTLQVSFEYEESILLIKLGVNNHVAGLILAFLIGITVYFGQIFINYIPTVVIVTIIIYLGLELIEEALIDSWKFFNNCEYSNIIVIIVAIMTIGFVEGIILGIMTSHTFFIVSNYRKGKIRTIFPDNSARSSVRRHFRDQQFLKKKSKQIKYLILDMYCVTGFEMNAVQVLENIQKHLQHQKIYLVICGIKSHGSEQVRKPLEKLSFWKDSHNDYVNFFSKYNEAHEWCEDSLLRTHYAKHKPLFNDNQL